MPEPTGRSPGPDATRSSIWSSVASSTAGREQLDPVVRHRVVRCGDHHAEVRVVGVGQVGHGRGRQHTAAQCVDAFAGETGDHRGFQHFAAGAGIAADHRDASSSAARPGQPASGRGAEGQRELSGELAIGNPADAISAE
jgi:hypothetical protein